MTKIRSSVEITNLFDLRQTYGKIEQKRTTTLENEKMNWRKREITQRKDQKLFLLTHPQDKIANIVTRKNSGTDLDGEKTITTQIPIRETKVSYLLFL